MPSPRVPISKTVSLAWVDACRAGRAMPMVTLLALGILVATGLASYFASMAVLMSPGRTLAQWLESPAWFALMLLNSSLQIVLLAPLAIVIQRFVIHRDVAQSYPLNPLRPSYLRYVGTALALNLVYRSTDLISILAPSSRELPLAVNVGLALLTFVLMIAIVIAALRKIALFPAIAVNAPNATWSGWVPADAGNTFRTVLVLLSIMLPMAVCGMLLHTLVPISGSGETRGVVLALCMALLQLPSIAVSAAAIAQIYLATAVPVRPTAVSAQRPLPA